MCVLDFRLGKFEFADQVTDRVARETEPEEEEREGVNAVDYFGDVLLVVEVGSLKKEDLASKSAQLISTEYDLPGGGLHVHLAAQLSARTGKTDRCCPNA